jgi:hypothetical protein
MGPECKYVRLYAAANAAANALECKYVLLCIASNAFECAPNGP